MLAAQSFVEIEDFRRARPDAIAHSAAKIISRLKAGGEKTMQALKSLCWRCMGIQVQVTREWYLKVLVIMGNLLWLLTHTNLCNLVNS